MVTKQDDHDSRPYKVTCLAGTSDYYTESEIVAAKARVCFFDLTAPGDAIAVLGKVKLAGIIHAKLSVLHEDPEESDLCVALLFPFPFLAVHFLFSSFYF